ncbi:FAD-dependent oxidoreductase [Streptomyces wuyuanensis]|uniref:FAD-dependent oxidoreductase n=1 Tax=Streptomyces wuyuanensis TaxID=1196353 RepID=UPI0034243B18
MTQHRHRHRDERAVVVGAGIAGLVAARVLADHFRDVVLIEQDDITADTAYRRGTPQARHPHALPSRGCDVLERLFPGLRAELSARGCPVIDMGKELNYLLPAGWAPKTPIGLTVHVMTRPTLEAHVRRRVLAIPEVTVRSGQRVVDLLWDDSRTRVLGVQTVPTGDRGARGVSQAAGIESSLVVCATGRTSVLPTWLSRAGYSTPRSVEVKGGITYSSCLLQPVESVTGAFRADAQLTFGPWFRRGGAAMTVEDNRCLVTLVGADGERPPNDPTGFRAYAASLRHPGIAAALKDPAALGPIYRMTNLNNEWTLYHRMPTWPNGLVAIGDAVCVLNPIYGQGMLLAAVEAELLGTLLSRWTSSRATRLERKFQQRVGRVIRVPWTMTTSTDLRWDSRRQHLGIRLMHWYADQVLALIPGSPDVYRRFYQVSQLATPPWALLHPSILYAVARASGRSPTLTDNPLNAVDGQPLGESP